MVLEPYEYAPGWAKSLIAEHNAAAGIGSKTFKAFLVAQFYEKSDATKYPVLRDRSEEYRKMLVGFGDANSRIETARYVGKELHDKYGFECVGAQFVQVYDIFWIV